jgi:hypothetical protein
VSSKAVNVRIEILKVYILLLFFSIGQIGFSFVVLFFTSKAVNAKEIEPMQKAGPFALLVDRPFSRLSCI